MSGNFVLQRQPTEPVCTLWACGKLEEALLKRMWLIRRDMVIEPTEALTVIDVDAGKYDGSKNVEETFALINGRGAGNSAPGICERKLSGIILIDFYQSEGPAGRRKELLGELTTFVKRIRSRFASWTSLLLDWWS